MASPNMCQALRIRLLMLSLSFSLAGIQAAGSKYLASSNFDADPSRPAYRLAFPDLEQECYSFLTRGLAVLIEHSHASAQAKFIPFGRQLGKLHPSGSPCPMDEWMLCLLCFWRGLSSICRLRLIYHALELSTWIRGARICLFMASSAVRVLLPPC